MKIFICLVLVWHKALSDEGLQYRSPHDDAKSLFEIWNQVFKNEIQLELGMGTRDSQPPAEGPPQNPDSEQNKMNQRLYEQEEQMEKIRMDINQQKEQQRQANEQQKLKDKANDKGAWGSKRPNGKGRSSGKGDGEGDEDEDEDGGGDSQGQNKVGSKSGKPKKPLQREEFDGSQGNSMSIEDIQFQTSAHKIGYISALIALILLLVQVREYFSKILSKPFRSALKGILLDTLLLLSLGFILIILYYNNFFDQWFYEDYEESGRTLSGIRMIQTHQSVSIQSGRDQYYLINVYQYLLFILAFFITVMFVNVYYVFLFYYQNQLMEKYETYWNQRQHVADIWYKESIELQQRSNTYKLITSYPNPPPQASTLLEQIREIEVLQTDLKLIIDHLCAKAQFIQNPPYLYPFMGPGALRDDFNFAEYMGYVLANTVYKCGLWRPIVLVTILIVIMLAGFLYFIFSQKMSTFKATFLVIMIIQGTIFYFMINLNFRATVCVEKVMLRSNDLDSCATLLKGEESIWFPKFLQDIYEDKIPTPDKYYNGPKVVQSLLFPLQSVNFCFYMVSLLQKLEILCLFLTLAFTYYFNELGFLRSFIVLSFQGIMLYITLVSLLPKIMMKISKAGNVEMMRDYDLMYKVVENQKKELIKACSHFYEFAKYLRRFNCQLKQEALIIHRPLLVKVVIEALQPFQGSGRLPEEFPYLDQNDPLEVDMKDLGLDQFHLGLLLSVQDLPSICKLIGVTDLDEYEMLYLINFCQIRVKPIQEGIFNQNEERPPDPKTESYFFFKKSQFFSPLRLLIYLQLRCQEVMLDPQLAIVDSLKQLVGIKFNQIEAKEIPKQLHQEEDDDRVYKKEKEKDRNKKQKEQEEQEEEHKDESQEELEKKQEKQHPEEQMKQFMNQQMLLTAVIDLEDLDRFLGDYCSANLFNRQYKDIIMNALRYLSQTTPVTLERLAQFVCNHIDFQPK